MPHFDRSKGFQAIVLSDKKGALLELWHSDLMYGSIVVSLPMNWVYEKDGLTIEFEPVVTCSGQSKSAVTTPKGDRLGYSGYFSWPLDKVIQVGTFLR